MIVNYNDKLINFNGKLLKFPSNVEPFTILDNNSVNFVNVKVSATSGFGSDKQNVTGYAPYQTFTFESDFTLSSYGLIHGHSSTDGYGSNTNIPFAPIIFHTETNNLVLSSSFTASAICNRDNVHISIGSDGLAIPRHSDDNSASGYYVEYTLDNPVKLKKGYTYFFPIVGNMSQNGNTNMKIYSSASPSIPKRDWIYLDKNILTTLSGGSATINLDPDYIKYNRNGGYTTINNSGDRC